MSTYTNLRKNKSESLKTKPGGPTDITNVTMPTVLSLFTLLWPLTFLCLQTCNNKSIFIRWLVVFICINLQNLISHHKTHFYQLIKSSPFSKISSSLHPFFQSKRYVSIYNLFIHVWFFVSIGFVMYVYICLIFTPNWVDDFLDFCCKY